MERINLNLSKVGIREQPAYGLTEAARYLGLPSATLRSWTIGRAYPKAKGLAQFQPLIKPAQKRPLLLSFFNLVEAHVARALRTEHGVKIKELRAAIKYAEDKLRIDHLLLNQDLCTHAGQVFLRKYGELLQLSASGQLAMSKLLEDHLQRVVWDDQKFPIRLYPYVSRKESRPIAIDPTIGFGRPVIVRAGISTETIVERIDAGETVKEIAEDYGLDQDEIEEAVLYERAAA